jgi:hypothetical protein
MTWDRSLESLLCRLQLAAGGGLAPQDSLSVEGLPDQHGLLQRLAHALHQGTRLGLLVFSLRGAGNDLGPLLRAARDTLDGAQLYRCDAVDRYAACLPGLTGEALIALAGRLRESLEAELRRRDSPTLLGIGLNDWTGLGTARSLLAGAGWAVHRAENFTDNRIYVVARPGSGGGQEGSGVLARPPRNGSPELRAGSARRFDDDPESWRPE